jgi:hypothetical protein
MYGIYFPAYTTSTNNWAIYNSGITNNLLGIDNSRSYFGTAQDAYITFDGNSLNIVANAVTAGDALEFTAGSYTFKVPADTDIALNFTGTTNSGVLTWMEDEDYFLFGDNVNLGANTLVTTGSIDCGATCEANAYTVGGVAGIDATVPVAPVLPATVAGSMTFVKGILTAYTAPS